MTEVCSKWARKIAKKARQNPLRVSHTFTTDDRAVERWFTLSWADRRAIILARDNYRCLYCHRRATHVDHLHPRVRGGGDEWWNLAAACERCNLRKHAKVEWWVDRWQRERADEVAAWADDYYTREVAV